MSLRDSLDLIKAVRPEAGTIVLEHEIMAELKNQKLRTMAERLANWILRTVPREAEGQWSRLPMSKQALALYLGTTPENLWRSFVALEPHGVGVRRREVLVAEFGKLSEFAGPNPLIDRAPRKAFRDDAQLSPTD